MIILLFVTAHWVLRINDNIIVCYGSLGVENQ